MDDTFYGLAEKPLKVKMDWKVNFGGQILPFLTKRLMSDLYRVMIGLNKDDWVFELHGMRVLSPPSCHGCGDGVCLLCINVTFHFLHTIKMLKNCVDLFSLWFQYSKIDFEFRFNK